MKVISLSARVVWYVLIAQVVAYLAVWILNIPLSLTGVRVDLDMIWNDLAENRARHELASSIRVGPDGPYIEPIPRLQRRLKENNTIHYAVFDLEMNNPLPGSSPDLVDRLSKMGDIKAINMNFRIDGAGEKTSRGVLAKADTSIGRVTLAIYGYSFHWDDLLYFFRDNVRDNFIYFVPTAATAAIIAAFAARRGLAPLRVAAAHARQIDLNSLEQRFPLEGIPAETLPLVEAINEVLARLDAGAARTRRFAANAAHELRTPVAILRTRIDGLPEAAIKSEIKRDVRRIETIVEQLLSATRLGAQAAPMDEVIDLSGLLRATVADYAPLVFENGRSIEFEPGAGTQVLGNRRAIEAVVANLIDNALRAEPVGGTVVVRLADAAALEVVDHGAGIAESEREMIFEPFWRGAETSPGTGLGLAIVKEIVELHGGVVSVEPTPGGGATFRISFPAFAGGTEGGDESFVTDSERSVSPQTAFSVMDRP